MARTFYAIYEAGVLRPLEALNDIAEHARVKLTVESVASAQEGLGPCIGILPDGDAAELRQVIESEFEQVNPRDWS